jgi:hypothetical protein
MSATAFDQAAANGPLTGAQAAAGAVAVAGKVGIADGVGDSVGSATTEGAWVGVLETSGIVVAGTPAETKVTVSVAGAA